MMAAMAEELAKRPDVIAAATDDVMTEGSRLRQLVVLDAEGRIEVEESGAPVLQENAVAKAAQALAEDLASTPDAKADCTLSLLMPDGSLRGLVNANFDEALRLWAEEAKAAD